MPTPVLNTMTSPNSASWIGATMRITTSSTPRMALKRVNVLARTIAPMLRLGLVGTALVAPSRTRCATWVSSSPTNGSTSPTTSAVSAITCTSEAGSRPYRKRSLGPVGG